MKLYELEGRPLPATFQERHKTLLATEAPETPEGAQPVGRVRQNPAYPQNALADDLDGWVHLEFDITDIGTVENVRALASRDKVFEQPAVEAVQGWRYVPKFENGLPVRSDATQTLITFCLEACYFGSNLPPERGPDGRFYPAETRSRRGNLNATSSPAYCAPLIATTRYCSPFSRYVIGEPLCGAGM